MGKKYQPSGYQIINIHFLINNGSGDYQFTPVTDDEKLLFQLLKANLINRF